MSFQSFTPDFSPPETILARAQQIEHHVAAMAPAEANVSPLVAQPSIIFRLAQVRWSETVGRRRVSRVCRPNDARAQASPNLGGSGSGARLRMETGAC